MKWAFKSQQETFVWTASSSSRRAAASVSASQKVTECIVSREWRGLNLQKGRVMVEGSWWINDCRWSQCHKVGIWNDALELGKQAHFVKETLSAASRSSSLVLWKCNKHYFLLFRWEYNKKNPVYVHGLPWDKVTGHETGVHQWTIWTLRHSFPLTQKKAIWRQLSLYDRNSDWAETSPVVLMCHWKMLYHCQKKSFIGSYTMKSFNCIEKNP